jgi:Putative DNA-binding domain
MIFYKPVDSITEQDIQELIDTQIDAQKAERKTVEYKQALPGGADNDKREFLADVSSFANTAGGNLLFGIEEQAGIPIKITGGQVDDADAYKLRLESMLRDGIAPRLPRVDVHPVALNSKPNHYVFLLRVQKSWLSPHRVIFKDHGHFYARNSGGKFRLDVTELRTAFELLGTTTERIRDFRAERLSRISAGEEIPALLNEEFPKLVLHMIPSSAFNSSISVDMKIFNDYSKWDLMRPLVVWDVPPPMSTRFNLDGVARLSQWIKHPETIPAGYVQVFRNSIIEVADITILGVYSNNKVFLGDIFELRLLQAVKKHLGLQRFLGVEPPVFIMVSLLRVKGFKIAYGDSPATYTEEIDRANLIIPEVMIDDFDGENDYIAEIMRPIFDTIWNAASHPFSPNYNIDGKYSKGWN